MKQVWINDPYGNNGFILADVDDNNNVILPDTNTVMKVVHTYPVNPSDVDYNDATLMMHLHEAGLLELLKKRYMSDNIYTYVAHILISINPYKKLAIYDNKTRESYRGKAMGILPPHVYAIADRSFRLLKSEKKNQSIIMSGESGAGKTECSKLLIQYLTSSTTIDNVLLDKIIYSTHIFEAFGNATSRRNNNSSRFGKMINIHFSPQNWKISGASINTFLLEKSRVVTKPIVGEKNYHILYYCKPKNEIFNILGTDDDDEKTGRDCDRDRDRDLIQAFKIFNIDKDKVYDVLKLVLYLGNIEFTSNKNSETTITSDIKECCRLLNTDTTTLTKALTTRTITTGKEKTTVLLSLTQSVHLRDALMKNIYVCLFDWIVDSINGCLVTTLPSTDDKLSISILDIYGFEFFDSNSIEQLYINYANEKLQHHFNDQLFKQEQLLYEKEGIHCENVEFIDNTDCIELIGGKDPSIFSILDEECKLPSGSDKGFTNKLFKHFSSNKTTISFPKLTSSHKLLHNECFVLKHFAGSVCYDTRTGFLDKNNDSLHPDTLSIITNSNLVIKHLYPPLPTTNTKKKDIQSISKKFNLQLSSLMTEMSQSTSHFIRCINPNDLQLSNTFIGDKVLQQLKSLGIFDALRVLHYGYPTRASYEQIYTRFKHYMPSSIQQLDNISFVKVLFMAMDFSHKDFQLGITKIFFRAGKLAFLDDLKSSDYLENVPHIIEKVRKWVTRQKLKKYILCVKTVNKIHNIILKQRLVSSLCKTVRILCIIHKAMFKPLYRLRNRINDRKQIIIVQSVVRRWLARKHLKRNISTSPIVNEYVSNTTNVLTNVLTNGSTNVLTNGLMNGLMNGSTDELITLDKKTLHNIMSRLLKLEKQVSDLTKKNINISVTPSILPKLIRPTTAKNVIAKTDEIGGKILQKDKDDLKNAIASICTYFESHEIGYEDKEFSGQLIRKGLIPAIQSLLLCGFKSWHFDGRKHIYDFYNWYSTINTNSVLKSAIIVVNSFQLMKDLDMKLRTLIIYLLNNNIITNLFTDIILDVSSLNLKKWFESYGIYNHQTSLTYVVQILKSINTCKFQLDVDYELSMSDT